VYNPFLPVTSTCNVTHACSQTQPQGFASHRGAALFRDMKGSSQSSVQACMAKGCQMKMEGPMEGQSILLAPQLLADSPGIFAWMRQGPSLSLKTTAGVSHSG
jgi:hypothetical protein